MKKLLLVVVGLFGCSTGRADEFAFMKNRIDTVEKKFDAKVAELEKQLAVIKAKVEGVPQPMPVKSSTFVAPPNPGLPPSATSHGQSFNGTVPQGMHAHRTATGQIVVHGNSNYGNAVAHAGIVHPWYRIAEAGQPVPSGASYRPTATPVYQPFRQAFSSGSGGCPGGNCPTSRR